MSHSIDEMYAVYDESAPRARKDHVCAACKEPIRAGSAYTRVNIVWDGSAETIKRCERCQKIHEHLRELGRGETWPAEKLDCGEDYEDEWGGPPPPEIAALAFLLPGETLDSSPLEWM